MEFNFPPHFNNGVPNRSFFIAMEDEEGINGAGRFIFAHSSKGIKHVTEAIQRYNRSDIQKIFKMGDISDFSDKFEDMKYFHDHNNVPYHLCVPRQFDRLLEDINTLFGGFSSFIVGYPCVHYCFFINKDGMWSGANCKNITSFDGFVFLSSSIEKMSYNIFNASSFEPITTI